MGDVVSLLKPGTRLWWTCGKRGRVPVMFVRWHLRGESAFVRAPHTGRQHEVLTSRLFRANDANAWEARRSELQAAELDKDAHQRLLNSQVVVGALVRELEREGGQGRKRTIEAVIAAARRLSVPAVSEVSR